MIYLSLRAACGNFFYKGDLLTTSKSAKDYGGRIGYNPGGYWVPPTVATRTMLQGKNATTAPPDPDTVTYAIIYGRWLGG